MDCEASSAPLTERIDDMQLIDWLSQSRGVSVVRVHSLTKGTPLRAVMTANNRRACRLNSPDLGKRLQELLGIFGVLRHDLFVEIRTNAKSVGRQQKFTTAIQLH